MDITTLYNPIVTPAIAALVVSSTVMLAVFKARAMIIKALDQARAKLFTRAGFFWTVNIVFMGVSVLQAGKFFAITGDYLGFAVSFFLDLVTIILMQAMLEARYRGEDARARLMLLFIAITCTTSSFANLAISLNTFNADVMLHNAPPLIQHIAPYVLASIPFFIIMISIAAEMIVNVRPLDSLNEEEYETDEKKRVSILSIRNTYLQKQCDQELVAMQIRAQMKANRSAHKRRLLPTSKHKLNAITATYQQQIDALQKQIEAMNNQLKEASKQEDINSTETRRDEDLPDLSIDMTQRLQEYYPGVLKWIENGVKSVSKREIMDSTKHSIQRINAHVGKTLKPTTRNGSKILVSSVIQWLQVVPLPEDNTDEIPTFSTNGHRITTTEDVITVESYPDILV